MKNPFKNPKKLAFSTAFSVSLSLVLVGAKTYAVENNPVVVNDSHKVNELAQQKDLDSLEKFFNQIKNLPDHEIKGKLNTLLDIANALTTYEFTVDSRPRARLLAQESIRLGLRFPDDMGLRTEMNFVEALGSKRKSVILLDDKAFSAQRKADVKSFLHPLKRIASLKKQGGPRTQMFTNVMPPRGAKGAWVAGMAPERISDPVLRAEYKKAIAENNKNIQLLNNYRDAQSAEETWLHSIEPKIVILYSRPPFNEAELKQLLDESAADETVKSRILTSVRASTSAPKTPQIN